MSEHLVTTKRIAELEEVRVEHQFNSNAIRFTKNLGSITGLKRLGTVSYTHLTLPTKRIV